MTDSAPVPAPRRRSKATRKSVTVPGATHARVVERWIAATNTLDKDLYLSFFTEDAVLDDPSVGETFEGKQGIGAYFESYFIGYDTKTRLTRIVAEEKQLHVEVRFTGSFPGGKIAGTFDVQFRGEMIVFVRADLAS